MPSGRVGRPPETGGTVRRPAGPGTSESERKMANDEELTTLRAEIDERSAAFETSAAGSVFELVSSAT